MDEMMPNQEQQREDKLQSRIERLVDLFKPELREALIPAMYSLVKSPEVSEYHKGEVDVEKLREFSKEWAKTFPTHERLLAESAHLSGQIRVAGLQPRAESEAWISVDEKLPENRSGWSHTSEVNVLIKTVINEIEYELVSTASYSHITKQWSEFIYNNNYNKNITHWQPLPAVPKTQTSK